MTEYRLMPASALRAGMDHRHYARQAYDATPPIGFRLLVGKSAKLVTIPLSEDEALEHIRALALAISNARRLAEKDQTSGVT